MVSILNSIKQMLGVGVEDTNFDQELVIHINGALMILNQLGIGPPKGIVITGADETWTELIGDRTDLELIKSDVYLRVRLIFDPPQNSFLVSAIQKQIEEYDWRIEVQHKPGAMEPLEPGSEMED